MIAAADNPGLWAVSHRHTSSVRVINEMERERRESSAEGAGVWGWGILILVAGVKCSAVSVCVCLSVCPHDKTKTAETITKLATGIVHQKSSSTNISTKVTG